MIEAEVERFERAVVILQDTEFRSPRTPSEWLRLNANRRRDYDKLLAAVMPLIDAFQAASAVERASIVDRLSTDGLGALRTFADAMAVVAIRKRSVNYARQGLVALAILSDVWNDPRDLGVYVGPLYHSALKLDEDARALLLDALPLVPAPQFQEAICRYSEGVANPLYQCREVITEDGYDLVPDGSGLESVIRGL